MVQALVTPEQLRCRSRRGRQRAQRRRSSGAAMLVLSGIAIVILGFALRLNPWSW